MIQIEKISSNLAQVLQKLGLSSEHFNLVVIEKTNQFRFHGPSMTKNELTLLNNTLSNFIQILESDYADCSFSQTINVLSESTDDMFVAGIFNEEDHSYSYLAQYHSLRNNDFPLCYNLMEIAIPSLLRSQSFNLHLFKTNIAVRIIKQFSQYSDELSETLFETFSQLSVMRYENASNKGEIILIPMQDKVPKGVFQLRNTILWSDNRGVRKMLEISNHGYKLFGNVNGVIGLGDNEDTQGKILIRFNGFNSFDFFFDNQGIFSGKYWKPYVYRQSLDKIQLKKTIRATFNTLTSNEVYDLAKLLTKALRNSKGTNILIDQNADEVATRLKSQSTLLKPLKCDANFLERVSCIDGTVIIDPFAKCYAIGAILDGMPSENCLSSRGGRYNSAVMYCQLSCSNCMIIVISQDGMVDILSNKKSIIYAQQ